MEMFERQVKRRMREWTEKHIIELIKQHSGGGIVTPPFKSVSLSYTPYDNSYVDILSTLNIREISNVASKILHLDTSKWRDSRILKSTLDTDWNDAGGITIDNSAVAVNGYQAGVEPYTCFLTPSPNTDVNHYNTFSQFKFKIKDGLLSLPDYLPFVNMLSFSFDGFEYGYGISSNSLFGVNSVIKSALGVDSDLFTTYNKTIWDDYTKVNGSVEDSGHYYRKEFVPSPADIYIIKSTFKKWFEKFNTMEIYIEVLNDDVIIRPDETPQEERIFYDDTIAEAFANPD